MRAYSIIFGLKDLRSLRPPQFDGDVRASARQRFAVRREGNRKHIIGVSGERLFQLAVARL